MGANGCVLQANWAIATPSAFVCRRQLQPGQAVARQETGDALGWEYRGVG